MVCVCACARDGVGAQVLLFLDMLGIFFLLLWRVRSGGLHDVFTPSASVHFDSPSFFLYLYTYLLTHTYLWLTYLLVWLTYLLVWLIYIYPPDGIMCIL